MVGPEGPIAEPMALATGDARRLNVEWMEHLPDGRFSGGNPELALTAQDWPGRANS